MSRKYNIVLFDFDGTLADTDPVFIETFRILYQKYPVDKDRTEDDVYAFSGPPIRKTLKQEFPDYDQRLLLNDFFTISRSFFKDYIFSYPNCRKALIELRQEGFKLGIISNKRHDLILEAMHYADLDFLFDVIIGPDDVKAGKPHPEGIYKAMEELEEKDPDKVVYIGDNVIDYETAKNAGVHVGIVKWGPRPFPDDLKVDFRFTNYSYLKEKLYE